MNNQFLEHYLETKKKISLMIVVLGILVISSFLIINNYSNNMLMGNKQLTYSISNIKYLTMGSYLALEKYDDEKGAEDLKKAMDYVKRNLKEIDILQNGGEIKGFEFIPSYNDTKITSLLGKVKGDLKVIENKIKNIKNKPVDHEHLFDPLMEDLYTLDEYQTKRFQKIYATYEEIKYTAYGFIFLLAVASLFVMRNINKEIEDRTLFTYIDKLTNIQNFNGYKNEIDKLLYFYERYHTSFSMIMFDIDDFTAINEKYGRRTANLVLIDLANLIYEKTRQNSDILFRAEGDRFIILCPNISLDDGIVTAEKIRTEIEANLNTIEDKTITSSIGVTDVKHNDNWESMYKRSEEYIHYSKENGKNKISSDHDFEEKEDETEENKGEEV